MIILLCQLHYVHLCTMHTVSPQQLLLNGSIKHKGNFAPWLFSPALHIDERSQPQSSDVYGFAQFKNDAESTNNMKNCHKALIWHWT